MVFCRTHFHEGCPGGIAKPIVKLDLVSESNPLPTSSNTTQLHFKLLEVQLNCLGEFSV